MVLFLVRGTSVLCSFLPIVNSVPAVPPADDFASLFDGAVTTTAIVAAAATTVVVVIFSFIFLVSFRLVFFAQCPLAA